MSVGCIHNSTFCPCAECSMRDNLALCYQWRNLNSSAVITEMEIGAEELHKKTPIIEFERQLLPQPPKDAKPWFCYTNTLIFYDKNHNEVWRQLIPEADQLEPFQTLAEDNRLDPRHGQHNIHVEYQEKWGWTLKFTTTHESAKRIWQVLFPHVNFGRELVFPIRDARKWEAL